MNKNRKKKAQIYQKIRQRGRSPLQIMPSRAKLQTHKLHAQMTTQREKQESSLLDITLEDKEEDNDDSDDLDARKELNNKWKGILHFTGTMILMHGEEYNSALFFLTLEDNFPIPT